MSHRLGVGGLGLKNPEVRVAAFRWLVFAEADVQINCEHPLSVTSGLDQVRTFRGIPRFLFGAEDPRQPSLMLERRISHVRLQTASS